MPDSSLIVACGKCGQRLRIPTERRGDAARCPRCKTPVEAREPAARRLFTRRSFGTALAVAGGAALAGLAWKFLPGTATEPETDPAPAGAVEAPFVDEPLVPELPPVLRPVPVPDFPGAFAVWGSTGLDDAGHVWFGASAYGVPEQSAHLFEYDPASGRVADRGDVLGQLRL